MITTTQHSQLRRGLSFLEFVGCLVAMTGGVVLGSMYLGVDVKQMAIGVLVEAQVVDADYFGVPSSDETATASATGEPSEIVAESETTEVETPEGSVDEVATSDVEVEQLQSEQPEKIELTREQQIAATRTYWDTLTKCMLAEAQGRVRGEGDPEQWQLYDYLTQRKRGHEQALTDLDALDAKGVDERLAGHGDQVVSWHRSGVKLFEHALSLLTDGPGAKLTGPFAQSWQSAATQLRMEEKLVLDRHIGVANYLDREYAEAAPFAPAFQ